MVNVDEAFELRYKKNGNEYQVLVDFDELKKFKEKPEEVDVYDVLADPKIFKDQKKGELASENNLESDFKGLSEDKILKEILLEGDCQIPTAYLNKLRDEKKQQIVNYISTNAINGVTKTKFTPGMIESEMNNITYNIKPEVDHIRQAEDVIKLLIGKIPISIETSLIELAVPPKYIGAFYGPFRKLGTIKKEYYDDQGNLRLHIEVTSGTVDDVINYIKKHANNEASYHVVNKD